MSQRATFRQIPHEAVQLQAAVPGDVFCLHLQRRQLRAPRRQHRPSRRSGTYHATEACDSTRLSVRCRICSADHGPANAEQPNINSQVWHKQCGSTHSHTCYEVKACSRVEVCAPVCRHVGCELWLPDASGHDSQHPEAGWQHRRMAVNCMLTHRVRQMPGQLHVSWLKRRRRHSIEQRHQTQTQISCRLNRAQRIRKRAGLQLSDANYAAYTCNCE